MNEGVATFFAPITLLLGGALFTIGALSLFGLNYFKTKFQDRVALAAGLALLVATEALFVTSTGGSRYFAGQQTDVTDCEYKVEQDFPYDRRKNNGVIHREITNCMDRLGYTWIEDHEHCREAPVATNPFCYLPKRALERTVVAFQMKFE